MCELRGSIYLYVFIDQKIASAVLGKTRVHVKVLAMTSHVEKVARCKNVHVLKERKNLVPTERRKNNRLCVNYPNVQVSSCNIYINGKND